MARADGAAEDPADWLSLDYVHEQVAAQLDVQSEIWDQVDGRLRLILGYIGIVFAAVLGLQRSNSPIPFLAGALAIAAVVLFLVAGTIVAVVYWPTDFDRPPKPSALRDEFLTADPRETKLSVIDTIVDAYNRNAAVIKRKILAFKVAFLLTGSATGLLGAAVIVQIALQTTPWRP